MTGFGCKTASSTLNVLPHKITVLCKISKDRKGYLCLKAAVVKVIKVVVNTCQT